MGQVINLDVKRSEKVAARRDEELKPLMAAIRSKDINAFEHEVKNCLNIDMFASLKRID